VETISFAGEGIATELLPLEELADCAASVLAGDGARILSYGTGAGYTPLRELVAEWFEVHPYHVVLTNGWLHGFGLFVGERVSGRSVVAEYPTYDRALHTLFAAGANLLYADSTELGINVEALAQKIQVTRRPALAYLIPSFQNPTGRTLALEDRVALVGLLCRGETLLLEDDSYAALRFEGEAPPTLFVLSERRSVYSTSFSYSIAPGLRVGVFILPGGLAGELAAQATSNYISPSLVSQATVYEFIQRGALAPHLERLRAGLKLRRDTLVAALERQLPQASWMSPEGGVFVMLTLPLGTDCEALLAQARGVEAHAGRALGGWPNMVRLNFGALSPEEIELGVQRLGAALGEGALAG